MITLLLLSLLTILSLTFAITQQQQHHPQHQQQQQQQQQQHQYKNDQSTPITTMPLGFIMSKQESLESSRIQQQHQQQQQQDHREVVKDKIQFSKDLLRQPERQRQRQLQGNNNNNNNDNIFDQDYSCDVFQDSCDSSLKYNGNCDRSTNNNDKCSGNNADCFDCDLCRQYNYDCHSCIQQTGCVWCPGDATCFNSRYYLSPGRALSCSTPNDYKTDTCTDTEPPAVDFFNDPLYAAQRWVYDMIHVEDVWAKGYFGTGIRVRVNDNGVDANHPEFENRFDRDASCSIVEPPEEEYLYPEYIFHGTSIAAIIGGGANNDICSVGIAPQVTLSACYAFSMGSSYEPFLAAKLDQMDISQNSFGLDGCSGDEQQQRRRRRREQANQCPFTLTGIPIPSPCNVCDFNQVTLSSQCQAVIIEYCRRYYEDDEGPCLEFLDILLGGELCQFDSLSDTTREELTTGILEGRDGKGIIYVFASGNANTFGDDTNFQSYTNSRLVITVGAVGKDGLHASYSTPGASVFVSAPGGDFENLSNHVTAGLDGQCVNAGQGTSFACPVVSGVIALMLQANPELTWRDVQGIIAATSQPVFNDPRDDGTSQINAAGFWHSNEYGFGIIDAAAAVAAAENWILYTPEQMIIGESGIVNIPISEINTIASTLTISTNDGSDFIAESVNVFLDIQDFSRGHLQITLTSPHGTKSYLSPGKRPENTILDDDERWKLLTVRHWDESVLGEWKLEIFDNKVGDAATCASAPWRFSQQLSLDCYALERLQYCVDGKLDPLGQLSPSDYDLLFTSVDNDRTAEEACCPCGGGLDTNDIVDLLRQWRLVVYGRSITGQQQQDPTTTSSPVSPPSTPNPITAAPVKPSTLAPVGSPPPPPIATTSTPVMAPSPLPKLLPSTSPSVAPSKIPTNEDNNSPTTTSPAPTESSKPTITNNNSSTPSTSTTFSPSSDSPSTNTSTSNTTFPTSAPFMAFSPTRTNNDTFSSSSTIALFSVACWTIILTLGMVALW